MQMPGSDRFIRTIDDYQAGMHPLVGQVVDEPIAEEDEVSDLVNPGGVGFYTRAAFRFFIEAQAASIGQVS